MEPTLSSASLEDILHELGRRANVKDSSVLAEKSEGVHASTTIGDAVASCLVDPSKPLGCSIVVHVMPKPTATTEKPDFSIVSSCLGNPRMGLQFMERLAMVMIDRMMKSDDLIAERQENEKQAKMDKLLGADKAEEN